MSRRSRFITAIIAILFLFASLTDLQVQQAKQPEISNVEEAVEYVRELQFDRDFELGTIEGERLTKEYPESVQLHAWYLANMARNDMAKEAVPKAEQLKEEHPDNPWSHFAMSITLNSHSERAEEALDEADKSLAMMPEHPDFVWLKAEVVYDQKGEKESIDFVNKVSQKMNTPVNLLTLKAKGLMAMSRDAEAEKSDQLFSEGIALFEQARGMDSTCTDGWYLPGYYYSINRQNDKAYPLLSKATENSTAMRVHSIYWRSVMGIDSQSFAG